MAEARIDAETRTEFGKGAARRTRRAGKIPAVLYGHGTDPQHLSLPSLEFARVVREQGRNAVLTLNIDGKPQLALTKTVVTHPIRPYIEHVDLLVISRGEKVAVEVALHIVGDAAPGTLVTQEINTLEVEADVSSIPEFIEVSVEGAEVGTQIHASDVQLPAGAELRTDPGALVVNVVASPTEAQMEAEVDAEAAGVVEDAPQTPESTEE
ncbi:50S ribosomal protein L25/general stress protein Ctc [Pseudonocardia nigra]|uniref:50S ribosomal protein L25/general stress protein Ctc n=1 Tax=Pseudonocardia nigra TaxID=1921578 RepID=UPI001C5F6810|nr:50S ribosomal protein L25/general stress protein Ctc [Pseudonocardia nigra]